MQDLINVRHTVDDQSILSERTFSSPRFKLRNQEANRKLHALQMEALSQSVRDPYRSKCNQNCQVLKIKWSFFKLSKQNYFFRSFFYVCVLPQWPVLRQWIIAFLSSFL